MEGIARLGPGAAGGCDVLRAVVEGQGDLSGRQGEVGWEGGWGRPSDFDLRPEGLLDVLCVRVTPRPDGEAAILPQG